RARLPTRGLQAASRQRLSRRVEPCAFELRQTHSAARHQPMPVASTKYPPDHPATGQQWAESTQIGALRPMALPCQVRPWGPRAPGEYIMATRMLIDARHPEETRVAVLNGNRIDEFDFE